MLRLVSSEHISELACMYTQIQPIQGSRLQWRRTILPFSEQVPRRWRGSAACTYIGHSTKISGTSLPCWGATPHCEPRAAHRRWGEGVGAGGLLPLEEQVKGPDGNKKIIHLKNATSLRPGRWSGGGWRQVGRGPRAEPRPWSGFDRPGILEEQGTPVQGPSRQPQDTAASPSPDGMSLGMLLGMSCTTIWRWGVVGAGPGQHTAEQKRPSQLPLLAWP